MNDWAAFIESIPWFLDRDAAVDFSAPRTKRPPSPVVATLFPHLCKLLAEASVTDVAVNGVRYELLCQVRTDTIRLRIVRQKVLVVIHSFAHM